MNHRITDSMRRLVEELHALREQLEVHLGGASAEAREEWRSLRGRIPPLVDLERQFLALSESALEEMKTKVTRFSAILRALGEGRAARAAAHKSARPTARRPS
jgi:ElaB/YqjD/DUF883 family membrane-anchored ribosome-binding protein